MIWLSSDLHLGHDREFIWGPRGFSNVYEHDEVIVNKICSKVKPDDDFYVCGDLILGDTNRGIGYLRLLPGRIHIIRGNHDTDARIARYKELPGVVEVMDAARFKYEKYHFYLSHYPTLTANLEKESLKQIEINLFGHTHQQANFYQDMPFMYHVGIDSHNCFPVSIDEVINDCEAKVKECLEYL